MFARLSSLALAVALALALAGPSRALPTFSLSLGVEGGPTMEITSAMIQAQIDAGTISLSQVGNVTTLTGGSFQIAGMWQFDITSIQIDPDPFVSFVGGFTNLSGVAQDFVLSTTVAILPVAPSSLIGGSSVVTYGDANFDGLGGLTNPTSGMPVYSGTVDGVDALDMLLAVNLSPAFAGDATQSASQTLGLPGPTIPYGPAALTIGITQRFNLSSLDQATVNSSFIVLPIPEPTTGLLVGLGLVAIGIARRRSHR